MEDHPLLGCQTTYLCPEIVKGCTDVSAWAWRRNAGMSLCVECDSIARTFFQTFPEQRKSLSSSDWEICGRHFIPWYTSYSLRQTAPAFYQLKKYISFNLITLNYMLCIFFFFSLAQQQDYYFNIIILTVWTQLLNSTLTLTSPDLLLLHYELKLLWFAVCWFICGQTSHILALSRTHSQKHIHNGSVSQSQIYSRTWCLEVAITFVFVCT